MRKTLEFVVVSMTISRPTPEKRLNTAVRLICAWHRSALVGIFTFTIICMFCVRTSYRQSTGRQLLQNQAKQQAQQHITQHALALCTSRSCIRLDWSLKLQGHPRALQHLCSIPLSTSHSAADSYLQ